MTAAAKADLGTKRVCPSCAARFYDLQKRPIECPKCHTTYEPEALFRTRRPRQPEAEPAVAAGAVAAEEAEEREDETEEAEAEAEEGAELEAVEPPVAAVTDEDEEEAEVTEEEEAAGAGMSVVTDVEGADLEDLEEEEVGEDEGDEGLLEQVEEEGDDVAGIIDPGIGKDER
jgi:uncharacterized protein (TIGR02300 family)